MKSLLQFLWLELAVRRRRVFLAATAIGVLGAFGAMLHHPDQKATPGLFLTGAAMGFLAMALIWILEWLQRSTGVEHRHGWTGAGKLIFGVVISLVALFLVAILLAAVSLIFL